MKITLNLFSKKEKLFDQLYFEYSKRMFLLCLRYLKDERDAEEALNNGFLSVYKNLGKMNYKNQVSFEAWIKKIMVNESLMILRGRKKTVFVSESKAIKESAESFEIDDDFSIEVYYEIIRKMPDGYRTVFNLYAIEGYDHKEISDMLKISENTSRSQLYHAREYLKKEILKLRVYEKQL